MIKHTLFTATLLATSSSMFVTAPAFALDCSNDKNIQIYESAVDAGRKDAKKHKGDNAKKHVKHMPNLSHHQKKCYKKGYHIGFDNASADMHKAATTQSHHNKNPYEAGSNEYEYYADGCKAGMKDGKANMSSVYQRYDYQYDSRFEKPFKKGYETCWKKYR